MYILFSALHLKKEMIFPWRVKLKIQYKMSYRFLSNNQVLLYGKAKPSVLIGSFLVGIFCVYSLFSKAGKFKTSMAQVPYNKLLTNLASSSRTGKYCSFLYRPRCTWSVLPRPRANIPQYGPRTQLVRGYINNSLHLARKYARIFVRGHYLFRVANSFPRA